jgi:hypothetical protein
MEYIDQPEVLLAASFSLYDLCHEAKPACILQPLLAYIHAQVNATTTQSLFLWIKVKL